MAESLSFCDSIVAVDGAYSTMDGPRISSGEEYAALDDACDRHGLDLHLYGPDDWHGGEVEKRDFMFKAGLLTATEYEDWFLIMDGDQLVTNVDAGTLRKKLAATPHDVGEVTFRHRTKPPEDQPFRSLFRALPTLRVEQAHYLYLAGEQDAPRYLWHKPAWDQGVTVEPCADLRQYLHILHRPDDRPAERLAAQKGYYEHRDRTNLERPDQQ